LTQLSYTATSLSQGRTYQFKVRARNVYGFSVFSSTISVLTAQPPAQPISPTTVWSPDNVIISWTSPDNGGSPITGYTVTIRQADGSTFTSDLTNCDMSASTATTCSVPVSSLRSSPYSLQWGDSVYAKVFATNIYGNSLVSDEGNGAIITTTPDRPLNLVEDTVHRTKSTLGLTWSQAEFTGGTAIIDYRVSIAQVGSAFSVIASNVVSPSYIAVDLTAGI
jgi:hypothetical protein